MTGIHGLTAEQEAFATHIGGAFVHACPGALCASQAGFDRKLVQFMARHGKRGALVRRLADAGLWKKSSR